MQILPAIGETRIGFRIKFSGDGLLQYSELNKSVLIAKIYHPFWKIPRHYL